MNAAFNFSRFLRIILNILIGIIFLSFMKVGNNEWRSLLVLLYAAVYILWLLNRFSISILRKFKRNE